MPLYELLCLTRPELARPEITKIIQRIGTSVLSSGGIITDIKSYGNQLLAYDIRVPYKKFDEAYIWQMNMMVKTDMVTELVNDMRINDKILRWTFVKRPMYKSPAEELLEKYRRPTYYSSMEEEHDGETGEQLVQTEINSKLEPTQQ